MHARTHTRTHAAPSNKPLPPPPRTSPDDRMLLTSSRNDSLTIWVSSNRNTVGLLSQPAWRYRPFRSSRNSACRVRVGVGVGICGGQGARGWVALDGWQGCVGGEKRKDCASDEGTASIQFYSLQGGLVQGWPGGTGPSGTGLGLMPVRVR